MQRGVGATGDVDGMHGATARHAAAVSIASQLGWRATLFCVAGTSLLMLPFAIDASALFILFWISLVPSALALTVAVVVLPLTHFLRETPLLRGFEARRVLTQTVLGIVLATALLVGWDVPSAGQAWRTSSAESVTGSTPSYSRPLSSREMTIGALLDQWRAPQSGPASFALRELHNRASVALWPPVLAMAAWYAYGRFRLRGVTAVLSWILAIVWFLVLRLIGLGTERFYGLPPGYGVWAPHVVAALVLLLMSRISSRVSAAKAPAP